MKVTINPPLTQDEEDNIKKFARIGGHHLREAIDNHNQTDALISIAATLGAIGIMLDTRRVEE